MSRSQTAISLESLYCQVQNGVNGFLCVKGANTWSLWVTPDWPSYPSWELFPLSLLERSQESLHVTYPPDVFPAQTFDGVGEKQTLNWNSTGVFQWFVDLWMLIFAVLCA